jgi:hypothetical protein
LQGGGNGLVPQLSGLRVLIQNQIAAGTFLVGDPRTTAIFDRAGTTVRVFEQDQDNAIKNLITVVIEKRLALVNYRPSAWVKGCLWYGNNRLNELMLFELVVNNGGVKIPAL